MYTQCPQCQAIFQVTAEHLKAAGGDVRCGQCLTVFNALDNLSEELPAPSETLVEPSLDEKPVGGIEDFPEWATVEPEIQAEAEPATQPASPDKIDLGDVEMGDLDTTFVDLSDYLASEDSAEAIQEFSALEESAEPAMEAVVEPETFAETTQAAAPETESVEPSVEEERKSFQVPSVLLEDLAREKAEHLRPSNTPWAIGSIALMLVFAVQAVYFARNDLARDPNLRGWLETACAHLGCTISHPSEIGKIDILGWDVRSHPTTPKALIASTTLINNASTPQPYPLLELQFSGITGTLLAQRRFKPREYLPAGTNFQAGMSPDTPVHVELELMDPGSAAVNFEFHAIPNPGTVSQGS